MAGADSTAKGPSWRHTPSWLTERLRLLQIIESIVYMCVCLVLCMATKVFTLPPSWPSSCVPRCLKPAARTDSAVSFVLRGRKPRKHTVPNRIRFLLSGCNDESCTFWRNMLKFIWKGSSQTIYQLQNGVTPFTLPTSASASTVCVLRTCRNTEWKWHHASCVELVEAPWITEPRDGRTLRKERKPRHVLALQRFINKGSGFLGRSNDQSLQELGLESLCPTHYHRPLACHSCWSDGGGFLLALRESKFIQVILWLCLPLFPTSGHRDAWGLQIGLTCSFCDRRVTQTTFSRSIWLRASGPPSAWWRTPPPRGSWTSLGKNDFGVPWFMLWLALHKSCKN